MNSSENFCYLVLVRHGQSEWNAKNLFTGWKDPSLTNKGKEEAKKAGEAIKEENIPVVMGNDMEGIKNILASVTTYSSKLRNNAGGFFNHTLFFNGLNPEDKGRTTDGKLEDMIKEQYGSIDEFKSKFVEAGMNHFGDGWLWLMFDKGQLTIASTDKQDNPYMDDIAIPGRIILAVDLWEHSYYLKYKNDRAKYIDAFFKIICFDTVDKRLMKAIDSTVA